MISGSCICNTHRRGMGCATRICLRELIFVAEPYHQPWATEMHALLLHIKHMMETTKAQEQTALSKSQEQAFQSEYDPLVRQELEINPTPPRVEGRRGQIKQSAPKNLLDRLQDHPEKVLAFCMTSMCRLTTIWPNGIFAWRRSNKKCRAGFAPPRAQRSFARCATTFQPPEKTTSVSWMSFAWRRRVHLMCQRLSPLWLNSYHLSFKVQKRISDANYLVLCQACFDKCDSDYPVSIQRRQAW